MTKKIWVLGGGSWGSALAHVARSAGHDVAVWSRANKDMRLARDADAVIVAVPAQAVRLVLTEVQVPDKAAVIIAAKGIERGSGHFMHQVVRSRAPENPALILSGQSFAADVLAGKPTAVTLGGPTLELANAWAQELSLPHFRIYGSDDVLGVALGGAIKNVLAIACGISDGRRLGDSARRPHHAELCRTHPFRPGDRRARRYADGPLLSRRPDADLHQSAVAQLFCGPPDRQRCCRA